MRPVRVVSVLGVCLVLGCGGGDALVRIDPESPGGNCPYGGQVIYQGIDDDGDGVLSDDEVASDGIYVCNGGDGFDGTDGFDGLDGEDGEDGGGGGIDLGPVVEGNYTIENSVDVALLAGVETITGTLTIEQGVTTIDLPDLVEVQGNFYMYAGNATLESVSFPSLTTIGGTLDIEYQELLVDLSGFSALTSVSALYIASNYALESIELPDCGVLDLIYLYDNDALATLSLPAAPAAMVDGSDLTIDDNDVLDMCMADGLLADLEDAGFTGSSYLDGGVACE